MEQNIMFESELVKNIIEMDSISLEEIKNSYFTIVIKGEDLNLSEEEYTKVVNDFNNLCSIVGENSISGLEVRNLDLTCKVEFSNILNKFSKYCDYIKIYNLKCASVETLFRRIFDKEFQTDENLVEEKEIQRLEYNKITKGLTINSGSIKYLNDYKQYVNAKNLFIEISEESGKNMQGVSGFSGSWKDGERMCGYHCQHHRSTGLP